MENNERIKNVFMTSSKKKNVFMTLSIVQEFSCHLGKKK